MAVLVCRKCRGDAEVKEIYRYRYKATAKIECKWCGNIWYIRVQPSCDENDIKRLNEYQKMTHNTKSSNLQDTKRYDSSEPLPTAMAIAIANANVMEKLQEESDKRKPG